ncbi:MAG: B12-binding domain-containing radical SAM protein [Deltaproteobacteria bacterium]|nr:B12-binding domain-containing radical SAM protein [Deltaproteobacteria bacterium]
MRRRKLILVNPTLSNPFPGFPPLGLGYVAALTPGHWDVEILDENFEAATFRPCDLVGITGFTAMANRAYQVARRFREGNVPVVMGGIHASTMPDEALRHADAVVVGEAESVWAQVIADAEAGHLKRRYRGTRVGLEGLVHPRRDLFSEKYICDTIQTARGCPNDCEFCSVSQFNGFAYRMRPVEEVLDEMATLRRKYLFIVDDNIIGYGSGRGERAIALARGMLKRKFTFAWYSQAALNVAENAEVLEAFRESGCRLLFLGIEAEDREVLRSMRKKVNLQRDYREVFRRIHEHRIGIHGSFIFGTDEDTMESLRRRLDFVLESPIDVIQYCTLTPYPGTKLFDHLLEEGRLLHTDFPADWDRYDLTEILFKPRHLDVGEYERLMRRIGDRVLGRWSMVARFLRSLRDTRNLKTATWCLLTNLIYSAPRDSAGRPGEKLWRLSHRAWPLIDLYQRLERIL